MAGWVYGAGSGGGGTPGGEDKDIQFNNNGKFSGSTNRLITDGSGSLSASTTISASSFHGDGSNLTGLTASAVNVADGPEFSIQFRRDSPVTGEISGSGLLMSDGAGAISASSNISASNFYLTPGQTIFFDGNTETAKIANNGPNLDINGNNIILNAATVVSASSNISGSGFHGLTIDLSSSQASSGLGQELQLGSGANRRIGAAEIEGSDYLMASNSDGRIVLSSSSGIELITDTTDGIGSFGSPIVVYTTQAGSTTAAFVDHNGNISASQNISGANVYVAAGNSIFLNGNTETFKIANNGTNLDINGLNIILNGEVSASANVSGSGFHGLTIDLSSSKASSGLGQELQLGSGANRRIGAAEIEGTDYLMASNSDGRIVLSSSSGIELITDTTDGIGSFGSPIVVYTSQAGSTTAAFVDHNGNISASQNISGANVYVAAGNSLFLNGSTETFKIANNGTNLDINGTNIILNASTLVSASSVLSASAFFGQEILTTAASTIQGVLSVGPGTGVGYVASNGDPDTRIRFGAAGLGSDSISIEAGGKAFIVLDENGRDELTLGTGVADVVHVSGSLTASVGLRVSASAADGQDIFVGAGNDRTIGCFQDSGADFFLMGHDAGTITLSSSSGVEFVTSKTTGVGLFASPLFVYNDPDGSDTRFSVSIAGAVSASSTVHGTNFIRKQAPSIYGSHFSASNAAELYLVKVDAAPVTASLPGLTLQAQIGETYTFKDYLGSGSVNSLHISPSGSQEIDDGSQLTIEQAFGAATVTAVSSSSRGFSWVVTSTT